MGGETAPGFVQHSSYSTRVRCLSLHIWLCFRNINKSALSIPVPDSRRQTLKLYQCFLFWKLWGFFCVGVQQRDLTAQLVCVLYIRFP